jgi:tetratricopeptide (TPR) repeat protein
MRRQAKILRITGWLGVLACLGLFSACAGYNEFVGAAPPGPAGGAALSATQHWDKAMEYRAKGNLRQAATELEQAIKADPNMYHAYYQLGVTHRMLGEMDKAKDIWQKGISLASAGPERTDYPKSKAIGQMQAALAALQAQAPATADKSSLRARDVKAEMGGKVKPGSVTGPYAVLFSSSLNPKYAKADQSRLAKLGYQATIKEHKIKGKSWHRVWVGCCLGYDKAKQLAAEMRKKGLKSDLTVMRVGK